MAVSPRSQDKLDDFICGGYFIAKLASNSGPVDFCEICKATLPPGEIVTLSTCLTVTLPNNWAYEWVSSSDEERQRSAAIWGLPESQLADFMRWTTEKQRAGEIGYPNVLLSLGAANELIRTFPISHDGWNTLGIGLRRDYTSNFVAVYTPTGPNEFPADTVTAVSKLAPLDPAGRIIGYEVLGLEANWFHSWYCSLAENDVSQALNIAPMPNGLIESYEDAERIAKAAAKPHDAAPWGTVPWYPWAVVSYSL